MMQKDSERKITNRAFYPMLVSEFPGKEDSGQMILDRWNTFDLLSETEQKRLLASDVPFVIKSIADQYEISDNGAEAISRMVRSIFLKKISVEKAIGYLPTQITDMAEENSRNIVNTIFAKIVNAEMLKEGFYEQLQTKNTHISIETALDKYPNINEQLISATPLKLRISSEPVRPSVKNWITDYHEQMGLGKHGTFDRGNYLFHSENAKRLTAAERQRVSAVLASLDEGTPLAVDPEKQQIIFNEQRTTNNEQQATNDKKLTTDNLQQTTFHVQNAESNRQFTPLNPRSNEVRSNLTGQAADNRQNTINNRQDTPYKMSQTTDSQKYEMENRQPKTINLRPEAGAASQMRQDTRPAAPVVNVQQRTMSQPQKPVTARPQVPHASFQGARPAAPPFNLPQEKTENLPQYFGARPNSGQRDVQLQRNVQSPAPKKEFENKSPNFSDLLRTQQDSNSPKTPTGPTQAAAPAGGTVSFSSPQQLTVERDAPVKRSPYRITPHDDIQQ